MIKVGCKRKFERANFSNKFSRVGSSLFNISILLDFGKKYSLAKLLILLARVKNKISELSNVYRFNFFLIYLTLILSIEKNTFNFLFNEKIWIILLSNEKKPHECSESVFVLSRVKIKFRDIYFCQLCVHDFFLWFIFHSIFLYSFQVKSSSLPWRENQISVSQGNAGKSLLPDSNCREKMNKKIIDLSLQKNLGFIFILYFVMTTFVCNQKAWKLKFTQIALKDTNLPLQMNFYFLINIVFLLFFIQNKDKFSIVTIILVIIYSTTIRLKMNEISRLRKMENSGSKNPNCFVSFLNNKVNCPIRFEFDKKSIDTFYTLTYFSYLESQNASWELVSLVRRENSLMGQKKTNKIKILTNRKLSNDNFARKKCRVANIETLRNEKKNSHLE